MSMFFSDEVLATAVRRYSDELYRSIMSANGLAFLASRHVDPMHRPTRRDRDRILLDAFRVELAELLEKHDASLVGDEYGDVEASVGLASADIDGRRGWTS